MLTKAFTMIELVFIITILGILSSVMIPRIQTSNLQEATDQLIRHIRLAKSMALSQDFYLGDSSQSNAYSNATQQSKAQKYWFKRWWQIQINETNNYYSVYSDHPSTTAGNEEFDQTVDYSMTSSLSDTIAIDSLTGEYITGLTSSGVPRLFLNANLENAYDVGISMPNCKHVNGNTSSSRILFDNLGRPHCNKAGSSNSLNPYDRLMNSQMKITLTELTTEETTNICIEAESGFIHVCK